MAEIFVSYARSTAPQAQQIAEALRGLGYGVWRDDELPAHRSYAEVIEERLNAAKAVVVVWSAEAARSEWVRSEADRARNERKLVQLTLDGAPLPMPFDQIQCADLSGWAGDLTTAGWRKVVASIADLVGGASPAHAPELQRKGVSICVLPFANMSGDVEQEYFADGISEDIITDLSKVSSLAVISRNSAFTFKGQHVDLPQVARQLKVTHVLEGSVRKAGNRVRITAQLIDGATNDHVWADRYDRDLDDIFALQDEISQAIVAALKLKLFPEEKKAIADRGTTNVEAYDKYLRARALLHQLGPDQLQRAVAIYREALRLDPDFAPAWHGLYGALMQTMAYVPETTAAALREIGEVSAQLARLAPDAWQTRTMRTMQLVMQRNWREADAAARAALASAPASAVEALTGYGEVAAILGRIEESVSFYLRAREADPLSLAVSGFLQILLDCAGRRDEAAAEYERGKDLAGDPARWDWFQTVRMWSRKDADPASVRAQFQVVLDHESLPLALNHVMADILDQPEVARAAIREAADDPANRDFSRTAQILFYADHYGDEDLVLALLRRGIDMNAALTAILWWPFETDVRADPRFKAIVRDVGLYDYWRASGNWGDFARPLGDDDFEIVR